MTKSPLSGLLILAKALGVKKIITCVRVSDMEEVIL